LPVFDTIVEVDTAQARYRQIKDHVIRLINTGELKPKDRVPSENDLVKSFGVARMTAHRALRELSDEGYVIRLAGVGTFVADARPHSDVLKVKNIADEIRTRGHVHAAQVIVLEKVEADQKLIERLELRPGASLFHSLILHFEDGDPIQLEDRYVCPMLAPDYLEQDFTKITPNVYLTKVSPLHTAEHVVRAVMPSSTTRKLLRLPSNEPCLMIRRRTWTEGRPVSFAELSHPGSKYELIGTMVAR
jgi:GntR family transcriptional regulator, histidine utilization repressor